MGHKARPCGIPFSATQHLLPPLAMFPTLGLFQKLPCPEKDSCQRVNCIFSHDPNLPPPPTIKIPVEAAIKPVAPGASTTSSSKPATTTPIPKTSFPHKSVVPPHKRPLATSSVGAEHGSTSEPPKKLQRVGPTQRPIAVPTGIQRNAEGVPVLRVSPALSQVAIPVRQTMLKTLYDHFVVLYKNILDKNPTLAAEHALKQEEEVYNKANKLTYRNAVISSVAQIKQRPFPDSVSHPSVGTNAEVAAKEEARKKLAALRLSTSQLEPYVMTKDELEHWGYIVDIPLGVGGEKPSEEGSIQKCERCGTQFKVKKMEEADQCVYHWGRPRIVRTSGEKQRIYTCCSRSMEDDGCERGPHVFYESDPTDLHRRHAFSFTRSPSQSDEGKDTALDIVALDCEMIYTTGGMRVARVSVVDSMGKEIFDEFVRMDEGVEVIDFNTRFSGVTPENYATAKLPLAGIRKSLDAFINANTIIIGHALENDLKTLRMIHHRVVDTAVMFPHKAGRPYRRALRDLVKEHLGKTIQSGGGTVGHSSVEDSIATLDLVRWHVLNGPKPQPKPSTDPPAKSTASKEDS
ncbi:ribonuclease H-like protein [Panus rudis PR-1116 ss-1]|nr:ribonuclease H-like protein [Panus rudis PR-1116 ss-1]